MTETEKAYVAGVIDGEGHVGIVKRRSPHCRCGFNYSPLLTVSNTKRELLDYLVWVTTFGRVKTRPARTAKAATAYEWRIYTREAASVLTDVLPYLILKREQASLLIQHAGEKNIYGVRGLPHDVQLGQITRYAQMRALNIRGSLTLGNIPNP